MKLTEDVKSDPILERATEGLLLIPIATFFKDKGSIQRKFPGDPSSPPLKFRWPAA
jgi:hypothetical protein